MPSGEQPLSVSSAFAVSKNPTGKLDLRAHGGCGRSNEECTGRVVHGDQTDLVSALWPASFLQAD